MRFNLLLGPANSSANSFANSFSVKDQRTRRKRDNRTVWSNVWKVTGLAIAPLLVGLTVIGPNGKAIAQSIPVTSTDTDVNEPEIPEEILRTEIITEARSPITGKPMTAAEYAQLQAELSDPTTDITVSDNIRYLVFLLQIRRTIKPIVPFW